MSNTPNKDHAPESKLLQALRETPGAALNRGVREIDKLSPEEEDGHGRWLKTQKKRSQTSYLLGLCIFYFLLYVR